MGVKTSDIQDAQAFLRKSKLDFSDGKQSNEISGEAWGGEKYSLKGMHPNNFVFKNFALLQP